MGPAAAVGREDHLSGAGAGRIWWGGAKRKRGEARARAHVARFGWARTFRLALKRCGAGKEGKGAGEKLQRF